MTKKKRVNLTGAIEKAKLEEQKAKESINLLANPVKDSFINFSQNLGIGADNALSTSTYGFLPISRNRTLLEWMHRGSWLAGVIVDCVGDDMTRAGVNHLGEVEPEDIERMEEVAIGLEIWNKLNEVVKWSRLYGGAIAVLLIDGQDNSTPLRIDTIRDGQFCGITVFDRWMVTPSVENLVTEYGPDLGLPKFYQVTYQAPALSGQIIHHSRCIRLSGLKLPYWQSLMENLWGLSVLERIYDRMIAFDSATTGAAQLVYKAYLRTYKVKGLREVIAAGGDALNGLSNSIDFMRRYQSIEGVTLIDADDELTADTHTAFTGLSDILQQLEGQLAGGVQIPIVRLFGQSPSGFSTGDTDLQNYYDNIMQQQEKDLRAGVTKVYRCIAASCGMAIPEGWKIEFRSLWQTTSAEKATISGQNFDTISRAEEIGLIDKATALKELKQCSKDTGLFTNITDEMISEAENELPPLPETIGTGEFIKPEEVARMQELNLSDSDEEDEPIETHDVNDMQSAGILFTSPEERFLLIKRSDNSDDYPGYWCLPGGHHENGETLKTTAIREAKEETGFLCKNIEYLGKSGNFTAFYVEVNHEFVPVINDELTEADWFGPDDLPQPIIPNCKEFIKAYQNG